MAPPDASSVNDDVDESNVHVIVGVYAALTVTMRRSPTAQDGNSTVWLVLVEALPPVSVAVGKAIYTLP
jgi:hypothetical protein